MVPPTVLRRFLGFALAAMSILLTLNVYVATRPPPADRWADLARDPQRLLAEVETPAPTGGYRFRHLNTDATPVSWDPCRPINMVLNLDRAPSQVRELLMSAIGDITAASGLVLVVQGDTDEAASVDRADSQDRYGPGWAPVLLVWTDQEQVPELDDDTLALTFVSAYEHGDIDVYTSGEVTLNGPRLSEVLAGPAGPARLRQTLLHELGHLVGLDHVADPEQMMFWRSSTLSEFGPGDRYALARLGSGPCLRAG